MKALQLALVVAAFLRADDLKVVSDMEGQRIRYRAVIGHLSQETFKKMASDLLSPQSITLGTFSDFGSLPDHVIAGPRGFDHCSYGHWRSVLDDYNKSASGCPEVKEAAKIGSAIMIRSVDRDCRPTNEILQGTADPLDLVAGGVRIQVLEMSFSHPMGKANEQRIRVQLYARATGTASVELAKALTSAIKDATGVGRISVELRPDHWFITDCGFPAFFPFQNQLKVPSREEFSQTKYASCGLFDFTHGVIRCFEGKSLP